MKIKATLLFVAIAAAAMVAYSFYSKGKSSDAEREAERKEQLERESRTDAGRIKGTISLGLDNYLGYYPLRSQKMKQRLLQEGYKLNVSDDGADYNSRTEKIRSGELDFAVFTVDSYLLNAAPDFPGQIVMVISESKGADAIVAKKEIKTVNDLTEIAVTLDSPSHQLVKASIIDFGLDGLKEKLVPADGSSGALEALLSGEVSAAALWEPDISTALADDRFKTLLSTRDTSKLVVDILVASDAVVNDQSEKLEVLLETYFPVLRDYLKDTERLTSEIQSDAKLSPEAAERVVNSVAWFSLAQNAGQWFGIQSKSSPQPEFRIVDTVDLTTDILTSFGDFQSSPLPAGGAFPLISSQVLGKLQERQADGQSIADGRVNFSRLSPAQWTSLDEVASLKIRPISFRRGTDDVSEESVTELEAVKNVLSRYPRYRLRVEGHTSTQGDVAANKALSQARAESVQRYLVEHLNVSPHRVQAVGLGPDEPLKRGDGQSFRAWLSSLPRVEFHLLEEVY